MEKALSIVIGAIIVVALVVGLVILLALPTMWLWNWLMPDIFGLPTISIWQTVGLELLSFCFFGRVPTTTKNGGK